MKITETPDAKTRYERNSVLEDWSGQVLLVGLFIETVILFVFPNSKSVLERGLELLAYVMVFGGVFGEIHFASRAISRC
jgi:hypothetical protein